MGEWEVRIDDLTDKQREVADLIGAEKKAGGANGRVGSQDR